MNILVISQLYPQPDDVGDNKPTKTVEYFAKEWVESGNYVVVMHCPSKFPLLYYLVPSAIKNKLAGQSSNIIPPIESRKPLFRCDYGIPVYRLPMFKVFPGQGYSKVMMLKQTKEIIEILQKINFTPEVVIGHFANPSLELSVNLAEHYKAKSSIVFHHDCNERNIQRYRINELINRIGAVGARSIVEAKEVQELLKLIRTPFICYSGAPDDAVDACTKFCKKHDFSNGIKYIYVGSLIKRKHLDAVINAFVEKYRNSDMATLEIVGGGPEEDNIKSLLSQLNVDGKVIFTGKVPREDVLKKMGDSNIFTLISDGEAYGMVYIEAMLQGCLTIASKGGGFDGIIIDGENGFICNPGDAEMLKSIYDCICNMTMEERNRIGQNAIDTAVNYSEKVVAEQYLNDVLERN
ncbi:glycosyltransferase family 4 protein [Pelotomaculum propionicicum]|uniref:glycosyltransferase family 4 protein n=1 Tax=Pelotomaculum propionicicum TaxID=258475 RepID=UPI003B7A9841